MNYSLTPIADSPLGMERARHLLNRTMFGAGVSDYEQFATLTITEALDILLAETDQPEPPLQIWGEDPNVAFGDSWVDAGVDPGIRFNRKKSLRSWWIGQKLNQQTNLREKMVLFWHNHFVTETNVVNIPAYLFDYVQLIRLHALGNFKSLALEMTVNTAMVRYLDGNENTDKSPNENYAREVFELFTIGKGPMISEGNYTYYTEHDVQEGARVLTGWKINNTNLATYFNASKHDKGEKTFSEYYGNQSISDKGDKEYIELIEMIFAKTETARSLVKKLYRWFLYYKIDEEVLSQVINPLSDTLYNNGYDLKPVLRQLLSSEHFFDPNFKGCYIKNPLDFILGSMRKLEVAISDDLVTKYEIWNLLYLLSGYQELKLGSPPDVAGWPAYYLEPQFNELWINSATLPQKAEFSTKLIKGKYKKKGFVLKPDVIALAEKTSDPSFPDTLITELSELLLPVPVSADQIVNLKEVLIPGLPDYEWTLEWNNYKDNPEDQGLEEAIGNALRLLIEAIMHMPEYYLM